MHSITRFLTIALATSLFALPSTAMPQYAASSASTSLSTTTAAASTTTTASSTATATSTAPPQRKAILLTPSSNDEADCQDADFGSWDVSEYDCEEMEVVFEQKASAQEAPSTTDAPITSGSLGKSVGLASIGAGFVVVAGSVALL